MTDPVSNHVKLFVVPASDWDGLDAAGKEAVHDRNRRAVRQGMLSQGLRAPQERTVTFTGEERVTDTGHRGRDSVRLTYTIGATPSGTAEEYENVHMVVTDGPRTATEEAEWEAGAEQRVRDAHAVRAGTTTVAP